MKKAFTLIELLVVVLIIGILSAIALPQYEKAVEKAKAVQALTLMRSLNTAYKGYVLANGERTSKFSDLDVSIPFTGDVKGIENKGMKDTLSNDDWSAQIEYYNGVDGLYYANLYMTRISGTYAGAGFMSSFGEFSRLPDNVEGEIYCFERTLGTYRIIPSRAGDYCVKLFNGTLIHNESPIRIYRLP